MSTMFDNYDNIQDNYIPVNTNPNVCNRPDLTPAKVKMPYEEYDAEGNLIGYWWNYGDTITLQFDIDGLITVNNSDIIYTIANQAPSTTTVGTVGQKAYNTLDLKSWTCTAITDQAYTWTQDSTFTYPEDGTRNVYLSAASFLSNKTIHIRIFNFRMEQVAIKVFDGATEIYFDIDEELSKKLVKGTYYCSLTVYDANNTLIATLFNNDDCTLIVK